MMDEPPPASQASSHFALDPVTGDVLFKQETARRDALRKRGNCLTGCRELDEQVLLGGFERGSVVGVTSEEEEMGLLIGLQTIAHLLVSNIVSRTPSSPRALIITTLSVSTLLPILRDAIKTQILAAQIPLADLNAHLRSCLEHIAISRVFDINGLWEVLGELDLPPAAEQAELSASPERQRKGYQQKPNVETDEVVQPSVGETEIMDSEDEGGLSSPDSSREAPAKSAVHERMVDVPPRQMNVFASKDVQSASSVPDIILITHLSALLTSLFTNREKTSAHTTLQLMASHMRYLTRTLEHGGPLFLILNSTTSSSTTGNEIAPHTNPDAPEPLPHPQARSRPPKPLDPTLRSIFNPPPQSYGYDAPPTRRNKPSFGLVFTQLLDMHLLCTRIPKRRADAETLYAPPSSDHSLTHEQGDVEPSPKQVEYATVVEVLLDEVGAWEVGGRGRRTSREQRWGAVEVLREEGGLVRVVDAFETGVKRPVKEVRLAAGFGGRVDR